MQETITEFLRDNIYSDLIPRNLLAQHPLKIRFGHRQPLRHISSAIFSRDILTFQRESICSHPEPPWSRQMVFEEKCVALLCSFALLLCFVESLLFVVRLLRTSGAPHAGGRRPTAIGGSGGGAP